jgi:hypothetical protein
MCPFRICSPKLSSSVSVLLGLFEHCRRVRILLGTGTELGSQEIYREKLLAYSILPEVFWDNHAHCRSLRLMSTSSSRNLGVSFVSSTADTVS